MGNAGSTEARCLVCASSCRLVDMHAHQCPTCKLCGKAVRKYDPDYDEDTPFPFCPELCRESFFDSKILLLGDISTGGKTSFMIRAVEDIFHAHQSDDWGRLQTTAVLCQ